MPTNRHRADRIDRFLSHYADADASAALTDLLADARHWCDRNGEDFAELDRIAYQHYIAELDEQRGGGQ
jgi:hypothetical protein